MRISILASGSSGNCTLLETAKTRLLVDAGLNRRETIRRLALLGERLEKLDGILISHEHTDHVAGLPQIAAQTRASVYLTAGTHREVLRFLEEPARKKLTRTEQIRAGERFTIGDEIGRA